MQFVKVMATTAGGSGTAWRLYRVQDLMVVTPRRMFATLRRTLLRVVSS